ncbi:MAG: DNA repair protein RecO [Clostridiaceae bacterium]|nr:DNA repair protein RecO [Clostridiaceae bacterium]
MSHINVRGFVLRDQPVGDADRLISVLTADHGLITAAARGARRQKSSLLASTQIFALSQFQLFQNRGRYTVDSAELDESFQGLHKDIYRLICAAHLAEVFIDLLKDDLPDKTAYELWGRAVNEVNRGQEPLLSIHVAQLRLLEHAGLKPPFELCSHCHGSVKAPALFSFRDSKIYCGSGCRSRSAGPSMLLSSGSLACLEHIFSSPLSRLFSFSLSDEIKQEVICFSDRWLTIQMEKQYTRLAMLQDLD